MRTLILQEGWSLAELLTALAVVGVLLCFGIPMFSDLSARNYLAMSANLILADLHAARVLAISRGVSVGFCAGTPAVGCHGDWARREWIVFINADSDGQLDVGEAVVTQGNIAENSSLQIAGNGPFLRAIVFNASGLARTPSGAFAAGRLRLCSARAIEPNATDIILIGSGRAVAEPHAAGQCRGSL